MTIKLGNTEINAIAVSSPYGDDVRVIPDEGPSTWTRPSHWLDMPTITSGEHRCAFLMAVPSGYDINNYVQFQCVGLGGGTINTDFRVDFGDGTTHSHSSSHSQYSIPAESTFDHEFDFDTLPASTQFEHEGTLYRQSLITIEANASGLKTFSWKGNISYDGGSRFPSHYFLDININLPSGVTIGGTNYGYNRYLPLLEKAKINAPKVTNIAYLLTDAYRLRSVEFGPFDNLTNIVGLLKNCHSLTEVPQLDTSNVTEAQGFLYDTAIRHYRNEYDFSSATRLNTLFQGCKHLKTAHIDIPNNTNIQYSNLFDGCRKLITVSGDWSCAATHSSAGKYAFNNCHALVNVPDINMSGLTNTEHMFSHCHSLRKTPRLLMPNVTNGRNMFNSCRSLKFVHIEDLSSPSAYRYESMFYGCTDLRKVKIGNFKLNCSYNNGLNSMFNSCYNLRKVEGTIDTSGSQILQSVFENCYKLQEVDEMKTPTINAFTSTFRGCVSLKKSPIVDVRCEGTGNVDLFRTFNNCISLQEIPNWDYSRVWRLRDTFAGCPQVSGGIENLNLDLNNKTVSTDVNNFAYPFNGCGIKYVNQLTIPESGVARYLFRNANKLKTIQDVNVSGVSDMLGMFESTYHLMSGVPLYVEQNIGYYRSAIPSGEIVRLFNGLASGVTSKTVDLRQAPEAYILTSDDMAIATSKGWTVTT